MDHAWAWREPGEGCLLSLILLLARSYEGWFWSSFHQREGQILCSTVLHHYSFTKHCKNRTLQERLRHCSALTFQWIRVLRGVMSKDSQSVVLVTLPISLQHLIFDRVTWRASTRLRPWIQTNLGPSDFAVRCSQQVFRLCCSKKQTDRPWSNRRGLLNEKAFKNLHALPTMEINQPNWSKPKVLVKVGLIKYSTLNPRWWITIVPNYYSIEYYGYADYYSWRNRCTLNPMGFSRLKASFRWTVSQWNGSTNGGSPTGLSGCGPDQTIHGDLAKRHVI